jgi:hypothetical protein
LLVSLAAIAVSWSTFAGAQGNSGSTSMDRPAAKSAQGAKEEGSPTGLSRSNSSGVDHASPGASHDAGSPKSAQGSRMDSEPAPKTSRNRTGTSSSPMPSKDASSARGAEEVKERNSPTGSRQ